MKKIILFNFIKEVQDQFNKNLKISEIDLACIHGGRKFHGTSKGKRPNQG